MLVPKNASTKTGEVKVGQRVSYRFRTCPRDRCCPTLGGQCVAVGLFIAKSAVRLGCRSMSLGGVTFPLEQQSKDPQSVVYSGQYDTEGVAHTKSGERQPVQVNIQVRTLVRPCTPVSKMELTQ